MSKSTETVKIDALGLCALAIDAKQKEGTPDYPKAKRLRDEGVKLWRAQNKRNAHHCPHCGRRI